MLFARVTLAPPVGAGWVRVTVQVLEEFGPRLGGELEQIQLLLGHASVQTTERYLGTKQDLVNAPNDGIKLRVAV